MKHLLSLLLLVLLAGPSCTKKVSQAGGLELMLMSDFPATDLTRVHLEISQETAPGEWHKVFDREQLVPQEVSLPTTASIAAGVSPNQGALIRFTGLYGDTELVQRVVQTQVPTERVAELKILLTVPCVGKVTACPFGESCQPKTGACGSNTVDSSTLPTYDAVDESSSTNPTGDSFTGGGGNGGAFMGGAGTPGFGGEAGRASPLGSGAAPLGAGGVGGVGPPLPCPEKASPTKAVVISDLLSDFEGTPSDAITGVNPTGRWFSYQNLAGSTITPVTGAWTAESPGHGGTGSALHVRGTIPPIGKTGIGGGGPLGVGVGFTLSNSIPTDVSAYAGISFYSKGYLGNGMYVQLATTQSPGNCVEHFVYTSVTADWTQHTVMFAAPQLSQAAFDPSRLLIIKFAVGAAGGAFDFWIDDVTLIH